MITRQSLPRAFYHAFKGLQNFFFRERNGKIQLCVGCITVVTAFLLHVSSFEWIVILLCIALVLSLEMLNSAIEKLCDLVHKDFHPVIKIIKDVSAASVLWSSIISTAIGCIIFIPKIIVLL
jgi:undecaprenol kinase/diacylglycerol kinase (ATP)